MAAEGITHRFAGAVQMGDIVLSGSRMVVINVDETPDVTGGGTTATVGFQATKSDGTAIDSEVILEFAVFEEAELATPSANATLDVATKGTILAGSGGNALKVKTDTTGKFTCTMTNAIDETVFLGCVPSFGSPAIDCRDTDSVAFSA